MTGAGFHQRRPMSPGGLALVIGMHAAAFTALVMVRTTIDRTALPVTKIFHIPVPPTEPDPPPEPQPRQPAPRQPTFMDTLPPIVDRPVLGPTISNPPLRPAPPTLDTGPRVELAGTPQLPSPPVRVEARFDPRYADDLLPPYPAAEERAQREGSVRVQVTIGADGRVKAIQCVRATSDAFCRATERHALARWRFRPATLDGRAVESRKVMNLQFRIET